MTWLRDRLLAWLFPPVLIVEAPRVPPLACPKCGITHVALPIPTSAPHATVKCTCGAAFDVFPGAGWRTHLRPNG